MNEEDRLRRARAAVVVAGVDAGKFGHAIVARTPSGATAKVLKFAADRDGFERAAAYVLAFAEKVAGRPVAPGECLIGIEFAGSAGFTLAHHLDVAGFPVVNVLTYTTKHESKKTYGRKQKTDAKDAAVIAKLVAQGEFAGFPFLDPAYARLRQLVAALERLTGNLGMAVTRLRHALHTSFPEFEALVGDIVGKVTPLALLTAYPSPRALLAAPEADVLALVKSASRGQLRDPFVGRLLAAARRTIGLPGAGRIESEVPIVVEQIRLYERQYDELRAEVSRTLASSPEATALATIPGLGAVTIAAILGTLGDVHAYRSVVQVQRLAGLDLTERDSSGTKLSTPRLTKAGHGVLRRYVYLAALRQVGEDGLYYVRYQALRARNGGQGTKAVIAVARQLLELIYVVARTRRPFDRAIFDATTRALPTYAPPAPAPARDGIAHVADGSDPGPSTRRSRRQRRRAALAELAAAVPASRKGKKAKREDLKRDWRQRVQEVTAVDAAARGLTTTP